MSFKNHLHIWYLCSMLIILHGFPPTKVQGSSMFSAHQRSYGDKLYQFYCQEEDCTLRLNLNLKAKLALVINNRSFYLHLKATATAKKKKNWRKELRWERTKTQKEQKYRAPQIFISFVLYTARSRINRLLCLCFTAEKAAANNSHTSTG